MDRFECVADRWIVFACVLLLAFTGIVSAEQPKGNGDVLYWTDPMVPGSHFDHPGKSPFMDMQLVPVYSNQPGIVTVTSGQQRLLALRTETVVPRQLARTITTEGDITYDERNVHDVTVRVNARVSRYFPFHKGLIVKKGQPLYELQGPEIYTYIRDFLQLKRNAKKINAVSTSGSHIVQQSLTTLLWRGIPKETIDEAIESAKPTDKIIIRSPITGMILKRFAVQGSLVNAGIKTGQFTTYGETVARVVDLSFVYAEAKLWGEQMDYVKPGMIAEVRPQDSPNQIYTAKVTYVYPVLKSGRRFGIARIAIDNPGYTLKPGMFAQIHIRPQTAAKPMLAVHRNAVTYLASGAIVFVQIDETHFQRRKIKAGMPVGDWVPVLNGLESGEQVIAGGGSFFLFADTALQNQ